MTLMELVRPVMGAPGQSAFAFLVLCLAGLGLPAGAQGADRDLRAAVVVLAPKASRPEHKAADMLIDEVAKRSGIRWQLKSEWPRDGVPVIALGQAAALPARPGDGGAARAIPALRPEGYWIGMEEPAGAAPAVWVAGHDPRGVLFGVGRLLRELRFARAAVSLADSFTVTSAPRYPLRGHQLGYRPKTNSYDGWSLPIWEQYIRDLVVYGTNAVELIPPRSDDAADSPHFPLPPMEMMVAMSRLLDDYGLDVWIWYPALDRDYTDPATVQAALAEWGAVFQKLPRIDAIFVPGGDPGHTRPRTLLSLLEKQTQALHRYHPRAQMWVSPQGFTREWLDEFCGILEKEAPSWLTGVVYGPQVRGTLPEVRARIPARYPIRRYPDITHSRQCQFPVPDWDLAFALTEERECINPRPLGMANIFRLYQSSAIGFLTYSEGCNDDVNKIIWSSLGWDPAADVTAILRDYANYFLGARYRDSFAQGLLALERNWQGPLLTNAGVSTTLLQFQTLEKSATPQDLLNWRFQQALYRAYYDAYEQRRLQYETELESRALDQLRQAPRRGPLLAMARAEAVLDRALTEPVATDWRSRIHELAEALYQSIRMQLSVERYQAISVDRGANLDTLEVPLNNRDWLRERFAEIRRQGTDAERLASIDRLVHWTDPGPGGFYDDLGNPAAQPHLVRGPGFAVDPSFRKSALIGHRLHEGWRRAWCRHAEALYDGPLQMHYTGLDPQAAYRVRLVYAGDGFRLRIRLVANETDEIHGWQLKPYPVRPLEFDLPARATATGELTLSWYPEPGRGGNGRGCQVAEVWLMKRP